MLAGTGKSSAEKGSRLTRKHDFSVSAVNQHAIFTRKPRVWLPAALIWRQILDTLCGRDGLLTLMKAGKLSDFVKFNQLTIDYFFISTSKC